MMDECRKQPRSCAHRKQRSYFVEMDWWRLVRDIVVVTGDLDIVPAFKLARTEGLRVYVDMMGSETASDKLTIHSDCVLG